MPAMSNLEAKGTEQTETRNCLTCKCEYINVADPCQVCREKGLRCTASDKIWGNARRLRQAVEGDPTEIQAGDVEWPKDDDGVEEIPRQPPTSAGNMLGPVDGALLQFYIATVHGDYVEIFAEVKGAGSGWRSEPLGHDVLKRFGPTLASMAVRNAVILLSLQRQQRHIDNQSNDFLEMEYKDRFYGAMRNAIRRQAYTDVLYASYFACLWGLIDLSQRKGKTSSRDDFIKHLKGFCSVLITVAPVFTVTEILSTFILLGNLIEWTFYYTDSFQNSSMKDIFQPLEAAYIALESANRSVPRGHGPAYGDWLNLIPDDFFRMRRYCHVSDEVTIVALRYVERTEVEPFSSPAVLISLTDRPSDNRSRGFP